MTEDEIYLFDLNGYIVIEQLLSHDEVARCNEAIDQQVVDGHAHWHERVENESLSGSSETMAGTSHRQELRGNVLTWDRPRCDLFREMIAHPRVLPYFHEILGERYRLDAGPSVMGTRPGAEGHTLHNGGGEMKDIVHCYFFKNGRIFSGMIVLEVLLADEGPDDGGLAVIPGSHKANLPCPRDIKLWKTHREHVRKIPGRAGDAVIFTEALTHGALPWSADHDRRIVLSRFNPRCMVYHKITREATDQDALREMTDAQRSAVAIPGVSPGILVRHEESFKG